MDKTIPYLFDSISYSSPLMPISETLSNIGETKVRVFTKYRNRNRSYITDEVAESLINSVAGGIVPVVGFFDPEKQDFTSHTIEDLCCGYGYCKGFEGWEKHLDSDGIEREYAVFSVILFTNYFDAANKILGNPQSMELDPNSITGDWTTLEDGEEYYVYKTAKMKGFTVLGKNVEPCFQGAAFFSVDNADTKFDKFSALLIELQKQVNENAENNQGGEHKMNFNIAGVEGEHYEALFSKMNPSYTEENNFQLDEIIYELTDSTFSSFSCADKKHKTYNYSFNEEGAEIELVSEVSAFEMQETLNAKIAEFEALANELQELKQNFSEIQEKNQEMATSIDTYSNEKVTFENDIASLNEQIASLTNSLEEATSKITVYEQQLAEIELSKKEALIETYENVVSDEDIESIKASIQEFSYNELENKLALVFARNNVSNSSYAKKVPIKEQEETAFERLMKNYKR